MAEPTHKELADQMRSLSAWLLGERRGEHAEINRGQASKALLTAAALLDPVPLGVATPQEASPIWPIARLFIDSGGNVCGDSHLYAPGLPEGVHDVYPLPVDAEAVPIAGALVDVRPRDLTTAELDAIATECEAWVDSHVAAAIQREFRRVNGMAPSPADAHRPA